MADDKLRPIIIVKRKRAHGGGHHGGAWKVAYADFVTAMMAFFMVMWLVASVTKEQRAAMFEYFKNPSMETGKSIKSAPGQAGPGGASTAVINMGGAMDAPKTMDMPDEGLAKKLPEVTEDEVLASPIVASPLHLLDICATSDGGAAIVVSSMEFARRHGSSNPVRVRGISTVTPTFPNTVIEMPNFATDSSAALAPVCSAPCSAGVRWR